MRYLLLLLISVSLAWSADPLAVFTAKEHLGLEWTKTLVTYPLEVKAGAARPDDVRLVDAEGVEQPCQLWRVATHPDGSLKSARVSFYTSLDKNGSFSYLLLPEKPTVTVNMLAVSRDNAYLTLDNGVTAVRLPREGKAAIAPTVITEVPGPLQGFKLVTGAWTGGSAFFAADAETAPKVTGYTCDLLEQGPLFAEARVRYSFDNDGFYQCTLRLQAGDAALRVDEQSDLKMQGDEYALRAIFSLSGGGWQPDTAYWRANEGRLSGNADGFEVGMQAAGFDTKPYANRNYGSRKLNYAEPITKICDTAVWYPWHPNAYYLGLVDSRKLDVGDKAPSADVAEGALFREVIERKTVPFVGVVPMHAGNWRGAISAFNGMFFSHQKGDVTLQWPLIAARHPNSLLHTGEYDPTLSLSFIRRQWALITGPLQYHDTLLPFRSYEGYVNLDDYKDWVLEWQEDPKVTYPRLVFNKKDVERLKPKLAEHPGNDVLQKFLYFNDDEARTSQLWKTLVYNSCWSGPYGVAVHALRNEGWISSFRYAQMCGWAGSADELLSSAHLTREQRQTFRAYLAAACEVMSEPDFNPRGAMVHLGNPNMPINRFLGLTFTAALIPDHPRAKEWLDVSADYTRYKLAMNTAPGGGWSELLSYYPASAPHLIQAANVLKGTERLPDTAAQLAADVGAFPMYLLSPRDPRFAARMLPLWGHEGTGIATQWLPAAGVIRDQDKELATALAWSWDQGGRPMQEHHDAGFSERCVLHADLLTGVKPDYVPPIFRSTWIPGIGATLRAHAGDPNETYMSYRQGYMISHCDANQGDFVLYSKGAPPVALNPVAYPLHQHDPYIALDRDFGWYSHVRLGARTNKGGGWNHTSEIHAYGFSDTTDYLRGGVVYGGTRWSRQIAFMKGKSATGPNYFLFRDSFDTVGKDALPPTWWYIRNPAKKEAVTPTGNGLRYASPHGTTLDVRFLCPATVQVETRDETRKGPLYFGGAYNWQRAGSPVISGKGHNVTVEEMLVVSAVGPIPAGQDVLAVLYPQDAGEALPTYEVLAEGVVKVVTSEGTDVIFLDRKPISFTQGDIIFSGKAGAVRIYKDAVHLIIAEGPGEVTYRGVTLKSTVPMTRVLPLKGWKKQTIVIPEGKPFIDLKVDAQADAVHPGVTKRMRGDEVVYTFDSAEPINFDQDGVRFTGTSGRVTLNVTAKTVRFEMLAGESIGYEKLLAWGCDGPYEVTFRPDRVTGRYAGLGRFLNLTQPEGLDRLPMYVLDGQTYAPGTAGRTAILPLIPGEHRFELLALPQPPIWRNWQAWE